MTGKWLTVILCMLMVPGVHAQRKIHTQDAYQLPAHSPYLDNYNQIWTTQSENAAASMPCGGGDIGMNVWVEKGTVYFYMSKSGSFDENNSLLKAGRVSIKLNPNPFDEGDFRQELKLKDGYVQITGTRTVGTAKPLTAVLKIYADVYHPVARVAIEANQEVKANVAYESWRATDRVLKGKENNANSWKWAPQGEVKTYHDEISFLNNSVLFYHRNRDTTVFDAVVKQQALSKIKDSLDNPLQHLTFGGIMQGRNFKPTGTRDSIYMNTPFRAWVLSSIVPARKLNLQVALHTAQSPSLESWKSQLMEITQTGLKNQSGAASKSIAWWNNYWKRSFIFIHQPRDSEPWKAARNYQLFRYMLGCNAYGRCPTKFNGGLFTTDPSSVDTTLNFTPDFRNWGGGTHTAQNQRLVYWPMLKSGDSDMMAPQFDFYQLALKNATLRTRIYWKHAGASFTEQLENFGFPNPAEYGWKRPAGYDPGMEYNAWLEYEWDTALEFCLMILDTERFSGQNIKTYLPLIESCLTFFDEHYQYLARQRGSKPLDGQGHLVLYPGSGGETYKMAYNASSTIAGLKTVLTRLLELTEDVLTDEKREWATQLLTRVPPIPFREINGNAVISPALHWERVNNIESTQLYPVFPWGIFGLGKAGLDTAINTYRLDADALKFRSHIGWKQDNIFAARLGLTDEAVRLTLAKMKDSGRRFPAFWGPGYDWVPDHNWGGSGMIGMQEMLMQTDGRKILLFPAWPKEWNTHFRLHAPYQTIVEGRLENGKVTDLKVWPESRRKDIEIMLK